MKFERSRKIAASDADFAKDDGSLRLYNLPETKVCKAVRGLGSDVSSIAWAHTSETEIGNVWVAAGQKVELVESWNVVVHETHHTLDPLFLFGCPSHDTRCFAFPRFAGWYYRSGRRFQ